MARCNWSPSCDAGFPGAQRPPLSRARQGQDPRRHPTCVRAQARSVSPHTCVCPGLLIGGAGLALAIWTVRLFSSHGEGTPAPWDPPLVVRGPYRHVRNPMISAVLAIQLAEALVLGSWPLAGWMVVFFAANTVYLPLSEERGLERRFGEDYRRYAANVPR